MAQEAKDTGEVEMAQIPPQLVITSQGHVSEEHFSQNGVTKQVHVVVKNLVFTIEAVSTVDLSQSKCNLEAKLLYDFDKEEDSRLEVTYVKNEPMEYKVIIGEGGYKATFELRIKVLTSQHEDMLFRVRIQAFDPLTQMTFGATSLPIKVISKLTQLKKKDMSPAAAPNQKKRITNDVISSMLAQLNQQVQRQQKCIEMIMQKLMLETPPQILPNSMPDPLETLQIATSAINSIAETSVQHESLSASQDMLRPPDFETAFQQFVNAFANLPPHERRARLANMLEAVSADQLTDYLYDVMDNLPQKKKQRTT